MPESAKINERAIPDVKTLRRLKCQVTPDLLSAFNPSFSRNTFGTGMSSIQCLFASGQGGREHETSTQKYRPFM